MTQAKSFMLSGEQLSDAIGEYALSHKIITPGVFLTKLMWHTDFESQRVWVDVEMTESVGPPK